MSIRRASFAPALALFLAFTAPLVQLVDMPAAGAADKATSPAKQQIADAEYDMKELSRLLGLSDWETKKNVISMIEEQVKSCAASVAKVAKADPKWDVKAWEKTIADAKARSKKAADGLGSAKPAVASSGPNASSSAASDDIALTGGQLLSLEKKVADKTDWATDKDKRESARTAIQGFESGIKRIKTKDPKWDLKAWEKILKDAQERLKKADEAVSKVEAEDKRVYDLYQDYTWKLSKAEDGIKLMQQLESKPADMKIQSEQIFGNMVAFIQSVDVLDKACKEKKYDSIPIPGFYKSTSPNATDGCKLATRWKALGKKYVELQAKGAAASEAARLEKVMENAKSGNSIEAADHASLLDGKQAVEYFRKPYEKAAKLFDAASETAWFDSIPAAAAKYPKALEEGGKTSRWDKAAILQDGSITAAVAADHAKGGQLPEGQVIKVASWSDWSVEKDFLNRPIKRTRSADALVKIKGESFCRLYSRGFESTYQGYAWGKPFWFSAGSKFKISACK